MVVALLLHLVDNLGNAAAMVGSEVRVDHIFKSCLFFHSKLLIPLYYIRRDPNKNFRSIGGG